MVSRGFLLPASSQPKSLSVLESKADVLPHIIAFTLLICYSSKLKHDENLRIVDISNNTSCTVLVKEINPKGGHFRGLHGLPFLN